MPDRIDILGLTREALCAEARRRLPAGHGVAATVHRAAHREGRLALDGLGRRARDAWRGAFAVGVPEVVRTVEEPRDAGLPTAKATLAVGGGLEVETVRIPIGTVRESQCVSSQVGCAMACTFCETGRMGLLRDLTAAEIVGQVVAARVRLGWRPDTLVFQGMGEPLDAVPSVLGAITALGDPNGLAFAQDRITVCTSGHVDGLQQLKAAGLRRLNVALSLNAVDRATRERIMPIARRWPLEDVQRALIDLRPRRNWQLGVHWCLLPGINDARADARAIAAFVAPLGRVMLHVIPYNPGTAPLCRAPTEAEVVRFVGWLRDEGLPVRRRITKGRSAMAACGQLGNPALRRRNPRAPAPGQG